MPVVPMREILDRAFAERYGVAAINIVNDLTLEAVLAAATELEAPLIVQTSVKTVKSIGADVALRRCGARWPTTSPVPVTLHLDHCPDREWITTCLRDRLELGAVRRLRARRRGEHAPDDRGRRRGRRATAPRSRARSRASPASRTASAPTRRASVQPVEVVARVHRGDRRRTASRRRSATRTGLRGRAEPRRPSGSPTSSTRDPIPMVAARRHRADRRAVHRPDRAAAAPRSTSRRRSRSRSSTPTASTSRPNPGQVRPAVAVRARARGGEGDGGASTSASSARPARRRRRRGADRVPALIFDCDGVLADTERYGHLPAFNQTFARVRPAGALVARRSTASKLQIGGGKERMASAAHRRSSSRANGLPADPEGQTRAARRLAQAQDRDLHGDGRAPAGCPAGPGIAPDRRRGARRGLDARGRLDLGRGVGAGGARARRRRRAGRATSRSSPATSCRPRSPPRTSTCSPLERARAPTRDDAIVVEDSRNGLLAAVGAGPALRRHGQRLHRGRGLQRGGARRHEPRRPRRAGARARQPQRRRARATRSTLADLEACLRRTPATRRRRMSDTALRQARARRPDDRADRGRQREVLRRPRRGRRRRRLRLLAGARLRDRARATGTSSSTTDIGALLKKIAIVAHQPDRRHLRADLGHRVPARRRRRSADKPEPERRRTSSRCCAPRSRASSSAATPTSATRPCSTRSSRRSTRSRRRSPAARPATALERAAATARESGRGDQGHARQARPRVLHRRAQHRDSRRRRRDRRRRDVRGRRARPGAEPAPDGQQPVRRTDRRSRREEVRQRPAAVRARDAQGHRARQPRTRSSTSRSTT